MEPMIGEPLRKHSRVIPAQTQKPGDERGEGERYGPTSQLAEGQCA